MPMKTTKPNKKKTRLLWFVVFLLLVFLTLRAMTRGAGGFSADRMWELLRGANPFWLAMGLVCMVGFIVVEGFSLRQLEAFFGHRRSVRRNTVYAAADIYFSAITPSATGGQPASAVFMLRDGIPTAVTTMCLLVNVLLYTVSILVIGVFCFLLCPHLFVSFRPMSRVLILVGCLIQSLFVVGLLLLILRERIILRVASFFLNLAHKLHLVKQVEAKQQALRQMAQEYRDCIHAFRGGAYVICKAFLLNLLQRFCNMGVTLCVFLAVGGELGKSLEVMVAQGFVILGSNAVPIPGAVGIADFLFLDGFRQLIPDTACVEFLSRGISFYVCLIVSGAMVLLATVADILRRRRRRRTI